MSGSHVFVDEAKSKGYLVAAAVILPGEIATARRTVQSLVFPGQKRLHFQTERDQRRRAILSAFAPLRPEVLLYDGSAHPRRQQRDACLSALVADVADRHAAMLVLERDDSVAKVDRRLIAEEVNRVGCAGTLTYRHLSSSEEPLLAIPDAVAWCWQRGGVWRTELKNAGLGGTVRRV